MDNARFLLIGDSAISIELGDVISPEVNARVSALEQVLAARRIPGVIEMIPTYRALMVCYDPVRIAGTDLIRIAEEITGDIDMEGSRAITGRLLDLPVLYGGTRGMDLDEVAAYHHTTPEEIIRIHSEHIARVYMFGFLPGMGYLGSDNGFTIPRRPSPRTKVEGGSVIIWKDQTIILPNTSPTGWNVIGHTPVRLFDLNRQEPFLFRPGDRIRFVPVGEEEYQKIAAKEVG